MNTVQKAIELILHKGLRKYKSKNSKAGLVSIANQEKFESKVLNGKKNKKGSVFITRKKEDLSAKFGTRGVVLSSEEAVLDHVDRLLTGHLMYIILVHMVKMVFVQL